MSTNDPVKVSTNADFSHSSNNSIFINCENLNNTRTYTLGNREVHVCDICGVSLFSRNNLIRHRRKHTGERPFACSYCSKAFSRSDHLRRHTQIHEKTKSLSCFQYKTSVKKRDSPVPQQRTCKVEYTLSNELTQESIDADKKKCDDNIKKEENDEDADIFSYHHSDIIDGKCSNGCTLKLPTFVEDCNEYLEMNEKVLIKSQKKVEFVSKNYICEFCGALFVDSNSLSFHYKTYSNVDPFVCQYCGEWFLKLNNLLMHEQEHTGTKINDTCLQDERTPLFFGENQT